MTHARSVIVALLLICFACGLAYVSGKRAFQPMRNSFGPDWVCLPDVPKSTICMKRLGPPHAP